jgi:XisI protein
MAVTTEYPNIIKEVIEAYAKFIPSHGQIRLDPLFDDIHHRYALMQVGWDRGKRIRGNILYVTLQENKVCIEYDGIEPGITQDLIDRGIETQHIVHTFLPESIDQDEN